MRRRLPLLGALALAAGLLLWRMRPQAGLDEQPRWEPAPLARLATWQPGPPGSPGTRVLAIAWAAPMSVLGLLAAAVTRGRGRVTPDGLLVTHARGPVAAELRRRGFSATTLGHVVITVAEPSAALLAHERLHTRQAERLGPLFGPVYVALLAAYGYRRHPLERAARIAGRRAAAAPDR